MERPDAAWTTFSTSLGVCGVSWTLRGINSFFLPEATGAAIETRLTDTTGCTKTSSPPAWVKELIRKVRAHMKGHAQDFSAIPMDLSRISGFTLSVFQSARKIPSGTVTTYGELANLVGKPNAARSGGEGSQQEPDTAFITLPPSNRFLGKSWRFFRTRWFGNESRAP